MARVAFYGLSLARRRRRFGRPSRLGTTGMALALFVQLALPLMPMPRLADSAPSSLDRAAAIWGLANICVAPGERSGDDGDKRGQPASQDCPFCQLSQQIAGLMAPPANVVPAPPPCGGVPAIVAFRQAVPHRDLAASPPRGPPLV